MPTLISNSFESPSTEMVAKVDASNRTPDFRAIATGLRTMSSTLWSWRTTAHSPGLNVSLCRQFLDGVFCPYASSPFDSRLYSGTGSGHIRRPAALGLLLHCAPCGFRFLPKQIRSKNGTERQANFFRFPPKKQTFCTWEPGPLPRLRHVCPESIREFKTEKQTCI